LGYLYWKSHKLDLAQREFQNELSLDPNHAQAIAYLGDIQMKKGDVEGALTLLKKSVQLAPDLRVAYMDLGAVFTQQKNYIEAIDAFQHALKLDPEQPDAHYRLARLYQLTGKKTESDR
jgi:Flp pilus assembly protein TadD